MLILLKLGLLAKTNKVDEVNFSYFVSFFFFFSIKGYFSSFTHWNMMLSIIGHICLRLRWIKTNV